MNEPATIKRGVELELDIESLAYGGMGLARKDNFVATPMFDGVF